MVPQQNSAICKRTRVKRGKENILSADRLRHSERSFWKRIESGLSIFRQKVQTRVHRCQELLERIDRNSRQMRICYLQLMDMVENSKNLVSDEKEGNMQLLQLLDECYSEKRTVASKTQTVTPMIFGIPLKKASISLRRLNPFVEQQNQNISLDISDSSPAAEVGFSPPVSNSSSPGNVESLQRVPPPPPLPPSPPLVSISSSSSSSSSESEENFPDENSRHCSRRRKWHKAPTCTRSASGQELHLKKASISLKRLDPQSYLPVTESLKSKIMPFSRRRIQNGVLGSVLTTSSLETSAEVESTRNRHCRVQNCASCVPTLPDPLVVLTRLRSFPSSCELTSRDQNKISRSASSNVFSVQRNCNGKCKNTHEERENPNENHDDANQQETEVSTCGVKRRRLKHPVCVESDKHKLNGRTNSTRKAVNGDCSNTEVKKKKTGNLKKKKEDHLSTNTVKADEDPLEGPSWLYKDGVKSLKRIRKTYLTPLYYLSPTIYSSTDDSGNEMTEIERRNTKLRKKKTKRRGSRL